MAYAKVTMKDMLVVLFKREFYLNMLLMMIIAILPVLCGIFFILRLERFLKIKSMVSFPYNIILFFIFFIPGAIIVWRAYAYLIIFGKGSPSPRIENTKILVDIGPYAWVRHPSVIGKLLGLIGVGFIFGSPILIFIVIPALFAGSLIYNKCIQEKGCIDKFGEEYIHYRQRVPMIIPKFIRK
jgi:protein-S-isoprenylcysteine O-methyltransferase Ste14